MDDVQLDYDYLAQRALRRIVRDVLETTRDLGRSPGEHHFYIEFLTGAPGVGIPDHLRATYPDRMTIVLQHQFDDLIVDEKGFAVTLWFKGRQARLSIPYAAVTSFADPSVQFGLRFDALIETAEDETVEPEIAAAAPPPAALGESGDSAVVRLDAFRKK